MDTISLIPNANIGNASMVDGSPVILDGLLAQDCRLYFPLLPDVTFFLQSIQLPNISVKNVVQATRYVDANQIGEKLNFESFSISFMVDKKFKNWSSIFNWMKKMTVNGSSIDLVDNPILIINGQHTLKFVDAWPMSLSGIQMDATLPQAEYVKASLTLNYDYVDYVGSYATVDSTYNKNSSL